jgi:hypothetical protein
MPPRSTTGLAVDVTPLLPLSPPANTCSKTIPPGGRTVPKAPSSYDPVDPDLGFPPENPDRVDVTCNDDALRRKRRQRLRHRPRRPQSSAIFTGSRVVPISWLARTARSLAMKTYAAAGTPAEILHYRSLHAPPVGARPHRGGSGRDAESAATAATITNQISLPHWMGDCHRRHPSLGPPLRRPWSSGHRRAA